jgi:endonuclease V-like protein UPF0215 family
MGSNDQIKLPPDSTGKGVRVTEVTVDGTDVFQQVIQLSNSSDAIISPATAEKQDAIISALGGTVSESTIVDDITTTSVIYVGKAAIGSSEAAAVWQIKKIDETSGMLKILWADGNDNKDNNWANRVSLSYS